MATWRAWWVGDAIVGVALATSYAVFGGRFSFDAYALFGPLVWSAVRLRQRGAALVVAIVSACAVAGTALHHGPFARAQLSAGLLALQSFMGFVAAVTLLLCAAVAERDEARAQALGALKGRDDFLAIASHELRTPMSALLLKLGSMRRRLAKGGAVSAEAVSQAEAQTERLAQLVNRLLDVSRVEAGQLQIQRGPMDLADLVRGVTQRLDEEARRAGCVLRVSAPSSVRGNWDRLRLEQIVLNLLSNAFRHAPGEPVDVGLTVEAETVQLMVRDHGPGMPEDQVEAMFSRYSRGDSARERGGLGLGLYISRRLVEAHGGTLGARGNPGAGCAFIVELPLEGGLSSRSPSS